MSEVGESIIRGMKEAIAFANGEDVGAVVHIPEEIDVKRIRKRMKMSQPVFSDYFGFNVSTLRDWEQGRRVPEAPARALLLVIDKEPDAVRRALTNEPRHC